jgi:hypothetical protein
MGTTGPRVARARVSGWVGAVALLSSVAALACPAAGAQGLALSPLNGAPDASPRTQISFLGIPSSEIARVSVVGSRSGRHSGRIQAYASSPGASFLPAHPFTQGERVTASAIVGAKGHTRRVTTRFTIARMSGYRPPPTSGPAPAKPGTVDSFVSEPALHPPKLALTATAAGSAPGDVFITPTHGLGQSGPMIVDGQGRLIWYRPVSTGKVATNLQVQSYHGQSVLVWWQGNLADELGVGFGTNEIYSSAYTPIAAVSAGNGYQADLHDMQITPQGSAFITAYSVVDADLSSGGGSRSGTLQDAILQEIDIPTGLVMFEWHAFGHVALDASYSAPPRSARQPWDFFHINSVSPDPWGDGNFIVSARNTWAAYELSHTSGAVLWRLGGKRSSFKMGPGTGTAWQHDVRWQPDRTLTLFDNGAAPKAHSASRVIRERIDWRHRKVTLVGRDVRSPAVLAGSQGNYQMLPNGNSFVGWGEDPHFTEFSATGQMLLDGYIPSPGQSYRAYRFPWSATPAAPPAIAVKSSGAGVTVYASWNGATGVRGWRVLAGASPATLTPITTAPSTGFETAIALQRPDANFAVQALGAAGEVLGTSAAAHR